MTEEQGQSQSQRGSQGHPSVPPGADPSDAERQQQQQQEEEEGQEGEEDEEATVDLKDMESGYGGTEDEQGELEEVDVDEEEYVPGKRRRGRPRKKTKRQVAQGAPSPPHNAYMLFFADYRLLHAKEISNQQEMSRIVGEKWKALTEEERKVYFDRAAKEKEIYSNALAQYKSLNPNPVKEKKRRITRHPDEPVKKSGFLIFMDDFKNEYKQKNPGMKHRAADMSKLAGEAWNAMSTEDREPYLQKCEERKAEHKQWMEEGGRELKRAREEKIEGRMKKEREKAATRQASAAKMTATSVSGGSGALSPIPPSATNIASTSYTHTQQQLQQVVYQQQQHVQQQVLQQQQQKEVAAAVAQQRQVIEMQIEQNILAAGLSLDDPDTKRSIAAYAAAAMASHQSKQHAQHAQQQQQQQRRQVASAFAPTSVAEPSPLEFGGGALGPTTAVPAFVTSERAVGLPPLPVSMRPSSRLAAAAALPEAVAGVAEASLQPSLFASPAAFHASEVVPQEIQQSSSLPPTALAAPGAAPATVPAQNRLSTSPGTGRLLPAPPVDVDLDLQQSFAQRIQTQIDQQLATLRNLMILPTPPQHALLGEQQTPIEMGMVAGLPLLAGHPMIPAAPGGGGGGSGSVGVQQTQQQQPLVLASAAVVPPAHPPPAPAALQQGPTQLQLAQQQLEMTERLRQSILPQAVAATAGGGGLNVAVTSELLPPPPPPPPPPLVPGGPAAPPLPAPQPTLPPYVFNVAQPAPSFVQLPPMFGETTGLGTVHTLPAAPAAAAVAPSVAGGAAPAAVPGAALSASQVPVSLSLLPQVVLPQASAPYQAHSLLQQQQTQQQQQIQTQQQQVEAAQEFLQNQLMLLQVMQSMIQPNQQQQQVQQFQQPAASISPALAAAAASGAGAANTAGSGGNAFQNVNLLVPPPFPDVPIPDFVAHILPTGAPPPPPAPAHSQDGSSLNVPLEQQQQ